MGAHVITRRQRVMSCVLLRHSLPCLGSPTKRRTTLLTSEPRKSYHHPAHSWSNTHTGVTAPNFLHGSWGFELRSSCLHSEHLERLSLRPSTLYFLMTLGTLYLLPILIAHLSIQWVWHLCYLALTHSRYAVSWLVHERASTSS